MDLLLSNSGQDDEDATRRGEQMEAQTSPACQYQTSDVEIYRLSWFIARSNAALHLRVCVRRALLKELKG